MAKMHWVRQVLSSRERPPRPRDSAEPEVPFQLLESFSNDEPNEKG